MKDVLWVRATQVSFCYQNVFYENSPPLILLSVEKHTIVNTKISFNRLLL